MNERCELVVRGRRDLLLIFGDRADTSEPVCTTEGCLRIAAQAREQSHRSPSARIRELGDQIRRLGRLIRAYADGSYRDIGAGSVVLAVAAVLYLVTPLDLVPDGIPGAGLVDDATVLAFVLGKLRHELDRFAAWERADAIDVGSRVGSVSRARGRTSDRSPS